MAEHSKKERRAYLNDFHSDDSGTYSYQGAYYVLQGDSKRICREMAELWGSCAVLAGVTIANGYIPAPGMGNCFYVLLPYLVQLLAAVSAGLAVFRMGTGRKPLREYVYQASVLKLPFRFGLAAVGAGVTFGGEGIYLMIHGADDQAGFAVLFLLLEAAALVSAVIAYRGVFRMKWTVK